MVNPMSLQYYSTGLSEQDPHVITALFTRGSNRVAGFTGTQGSQPGGGVRLFQTTGAGVGLTQLQIDSFLGTDGEFAAASLDGPGVGAAQTGAILIRTDGQVDKILACSIEIADLTLISTSVQTYVKTSIALTAGAQSEIVLGSEGNLCIKFSALAATDGYTTAQVHCDVYYKAN